MNDLEIYHYGVKGMKWGVHKTYGERQVDKYTKKAKREAHKQHEGDIYTSRARNYSRLATDAYKAQGKGYGVEREMAQYNKKSERVTNKFANQIEKSSNEQLKITRDTAIGKITPEQAAKRTTVLLNKLEKQGLKAAKTEQKIQQGKEFILNHPEISNARVISADVGGVVGGFIAGAPGAIITSAVGYAVAQAVAKYFEDRKTSN